jgi:hypothetical protein
MSAGVAANGIGSSLNAGTKGAGCLDAALLVSKSVNGGPSLVLAGRGDEARGVLVRRHLSRQG